MKYWLAGVMFSLIVAIPLFTAHAGYVSGYYRSNGTYVQGYYRTEADGNPYNNYSFPGNYNPNTGKITGGNASTYLNNYYNSNSGSGYGSSYSYASSYTPSCPLNSYYDGISSCKCYAGYSANGSSCVSNDELCHAQIGYSSSYDSLTGTCKCSYGNIIGSSGTCTNANLYCSSEMGIMSQYNSSTKQCECTPGYIFNGSTCTYNSTSSSYSSYTPFSQNTLQCMASYGIRSSWDGLPAENGLISCICDPGYSWNSARTQCVAGSTS